MTNTAKGVSESMIPEEEKEHFRQVARRGVLHNDTNLYIYGKMLDKHLGRYGELKMPHAKAKLEKEIRRTARQIERHL